MVIYTQHLFRRKQRISSESSAALEGMLRTGEGEKAPSAVAPLQSFPEAPASQAESVPATKEIPVNSKYRAVWQRLRAKVKSQLFLKRLGLEIQLFGANLLAVPETEVNNDAAHQIVMKKLERSQNVLENEEKVIPTGVFLPASRFKTLWGMVYLLLMLYTAYILPYIMAFVEESSTWAKVDISVDILFFTDILITLNSAYYSTTGEVVTSRKRIFLNYLRSWLVVDLVACFPFDMVYTQEESADADSGSTFHYKSFLRLARLPRIYRLLRFTRVLKTIRNCHNSPRLEKLVENICGKGSVIRLFAFALIVSVCVHLMTCLWYFVARVEGLSPDTWVVQKGLQDAATTDVYIASLFYTVTTLATVGYGDIVPGTSLERLLSIAWMLFGVCFFSFTIGSLANLLNSLDSKESVLFTKLSAIEEFSSEAKLDATLRYRLKHALRFSIEQTGFSSSEKRDIFNELPRQLKYEVACAMHQGAAKTIPFFADKDQVFVAAVVPFLAGHIFEESAVIYKEKEFADEIYFISKGRCNLMVENKYVLKKMPQGSYFGAIEVIKQIPRQFTITAATRVDLLTMNKRLFYLIKSDFPAVYEEMVELEETRDYLNMKAKEYFYSMLSKYKNVKSVEGDSILRQMDSAGLTPSYSVLKSKKTEDRSRDPRIQQLEAVVSETQKLANSIFSIVTRHGGLPGQSPERLHGPADRSRADSGVSDSSGSALDQAQAKQE